MGLVVYNIDWAEAYLCTKWHFDPSSHLVTIDMGRELGVGLLTQCGLGRGLPP